MNPVDLLGTLAVAEVEMILVGGIAANVQGAPVVSFDVDIVYRRTPENIERLLHALVDLDAHARGDPRRLRPDASHLASSGHKLLATRFGSLDLLGALDQDTGYDELLPDTVQVRVGAHPIRVLALERLVREKEKLARPKDLAMLPLLRATLKLRKAQL